MRKTTVVGIAEASIVVLSQRDETDVLTLDEHHFRTLRGWRGDPFCLAPFDV